MANYCETLDDADLLAFGLDFRTIAPGEVEDDDEARADAVAAAKRSSAACAERNAATMQSRASVRSLLAKHARPLRPNEHNSAIVGSGEALSGTGTTKATASLPELEPPPYRQQFFGCPVLDEKAYRELWAWAEGLGADLGGVRWGRDQWGGSALFATRTFEPGATVLALPRCLRVGKKHCNLVGNNGSKSISGLPTNGNIDKSGIVEIIPSQSVPSLPADCPDLSALALLLLAWLPPPIWSQEQSLPLSEVSAAEEAAPHDGRSRNQSVNEKAGGSEVESSKSWALYAQCMPTLREVGNAVAMTPAEAQEWVKAAKSTGGDDDEIGGMKETIDAVRASAEACVSFVLQELAGLPLGDPSSSSAETNLKVSANISSYVNSNDLDNPADDGGVAALKWAVCMVVSRSHSLGSKTGRWLTPILDLANHLPEEDGGGTIGTNDGGWLVLKCGNQGLRTGDQVFLDYQVNNNTDLVAGYGFALDIQRPF